MLIAIVIIIATKAAMGMAPIQGFKSMIINNNDNPEIKVDNLDLPPFSLFITDCPTNAQPAMPPNKEDIILAIPCPLASLFLLELVSVASSKIS